MVTREVILCTSNTRCLQQILTSKSHFTNRNCVFEDNRFYVCMLCTWNSNVYSTNSKVMLQKRTLGCFLMLMRAPNLVSIIPFLSWHHGKLCRMISKHSVQEAGTWRQVTTSLGNCIRLSFGDSPSGHVAYAIVHEPKVWKHVNAQNDECSDTCSLHMRRQSDVGSHAEQFAHTVDRHSPSVNHAMQSFVTLESQRDKRSAQEVVLRRACCERNADVAAIGEADVCASGEGQCCLGPAANVGPARTHALRQQDSKSAVYR